MIMNGGSIAMNGEHTIHVLPPTLIDFSNVSASQTVTVPIAQRIYACGAAEVILVARLHGGTSIGASATLVCNLQLDAYTPNDPATQFQTALNTAASLTFTGSITAATMKYVASSISQGSAGASFGEHVAVTIAATQPAGAVSIKPILSVDLVFKGGHGMRGHKPGVFLGYV